MAEGGESSASTSIKEEDNTPEELKKKPVEIRISVFFDGTGNNRGNIAARKGGEHSNVYSTVKSQNSDASKYASFEAGYSNVSILEEQFESTTECKIFKPFYIEGVATRDIKRVAEEYAQKVRARAEFNKNRAPRHQSKVPIEMETDSTVGNAAALGATGLYAKVDAAFNKIQFWLMDEVFGATDPDGDTITDKTHEFTKIVVDVFGFSRGAATARHFIHHVLNEPRTIVTPIPKNVLNPFAPARLRTYDVTTRTLKQAIESFGYEVKDDAVEIGFAGLFDTVSSYVVALTTDVKILHLDAIKHARKVYHLASAEEHRACFSLTNIHSAKTAGIGEEYFLPGVHSDIGGGYRDLNDGGGESEKYDLMNDDKTTIAFYQSTRTAGLTLDYHAFMGTLADEGWYKPSAQDKWYTSSDQPEKEAEMWLEKGAWWSGIIFTDVALKAKRSGIAHEYRYIPLQLMAEAMEKEQFKFKPNLKSKYKVSGNLSSIDQRIRNYVSTIGNHSKAEDWFTKQDGQLKTLRHKHLHYSARIDTGHWPRFKNQKRYRQYYDG